MSRPSGIWQRKRDRMWMTTLHGTQHKLSPDKTEARKLLNKLLAGDDPTPKKDRSGMTTRKLCDNYLVRTKFRKEPSTHESQVVQLRAFSKALGHRDPCSLKVHEIESWLDEQENWGESTKALFISTIKAVFNFGEEQGHFSQNPIKKLKRRSTGKRERVLSPEERTRIKATVSDRMRDFLELLEQTGCRPFSEGAKLTAADIDFEKGRSIRRKHKTQKKGKTRTLYFPPTILARLKELAATYPTGPLLRNSRGNAWTRANVSSYLLRVGEKLGIAPVSAYVWRHGYIGNALVRGVPVDVVAELVGNSPSVIRSNYSHLELMDEAMAAAAVKAIGG